MSEFFTDLQLIGMRPVVTFYERELLAYLSGVSPSVESEAERRA